MFDVIRRFVQENIYFYSSHFYAVTQVIDKLFVDTGSNREQHLQVSLHLVGARKVRRINHLHY